MKKITNFILASIGVIGGILVTEGVITGEELSSIQNVTGMALGGGALSIGMIIAIIRALPTQLVAKAYNKAVEKYGQDAVDNFVNKIDEVMDLQTQNNILLTEIKNELIEAKEQRQALLDE